MLRPGFTKNAASLDSEAVYQQRLFKRLGERLDFAYKMEKKLEKEKLPIIKETEKLDDEAAFKVWADTFKHNDYTLNIARRTLRVRRYFYYVFTMVALYGVFLTLPATNIFSVLSGVTALFFFGLSLLLGMKESWRYHQVKNRSLFPFMQMWESPIKFIW